MGKRVNIYLETKTHKQAKAISAIKGMQLGKYFEKAISDAIKKDKKLLEELLK